MSRDQEIIAKALEIAISLTKDADYTWLSTDEQEIVIKEPLFTTLKTVMRIINADNLCDRQGVIWNIFPK